MLVSSAEPVNLLLNKKHHQVKALLNPVYLSVGAVLLEQKALPALVPDKDLINLLSVSLANLHNIKPRLECLEQLRQ